MSARTRQRFLDVNREVLEKDGKHMSATWRLGMQRLLRKVEAETDKPEIRSFGQFVQRAAHFAATGQRDDHLQRAPTGLGETSPTIGGFLVPATFAEPVWQTVFSDRTSPLSYFKRFVVPDGSASLKVPGVDEVSRANGYRWGGLVADFADEGLAQTASFPKLKATEFAVEKMIAFVPISNELMADASNLTEYLVTAISDELSYKLEQYCLTSAGTGAGRPQSIMHSSALLTVAKVGGQAAGTLLYENLLSCWHALPSASRKRAIWVAGESVTKQIFTNASMPMVVAQYPAAGSTHAETDTPRIFGRPWIESDVMPIVGTSGDILLIDPAWYAIAHKPVATAMSAEVGFLSDQSYLKVVLRVDANPLVSAPLTASDGTTRSPFVALQAR